MQAATISLAWNPSPDAKTYKLYQAVGTPGTVPFVVILDTTNIFATVSYDVTMTHRWYVTSYNTNFAAPESVPSNTVGWDPVAPVLPGLAWESDAGVIELPMKVTGAYISQDVQTTAADGGRASYNFSITNAGVYNVVMVVNAPDDGANSVYVNIDNEPQEAQAWNIPLTTGFQERIVFWTGESAAHAFNLAAGRHALIIRGREANTQIDRLKVALANAPQPPGPPAPPVNLRIGQVSGNRYDISWQSEPQYSTAVERAPPNGAFSTLAAVGPGIMHYSTTIKPKESWFFRVKSCGSGCGLPSESILVRR